MSRSKKFVFAVITLLIFTSGLELTLRMSGFRFRYSLAAGLPDWVRFNMNRWFLDYDEELMWRPRSPNPDFEINPRGIRGQDVPASKSEFEFRVLCLGDSCTWGHGLDAADTYAAQLQALARERRPGDLDVSVVNAGVPGYSSFQGKIYFARRLEYVQPDMVTIYFGRNDSRIRPQQWNGKPDSGQRRSSGVLARTLRMVNGIRVYQLVSWGIYTVRKTTGQLPPPPATVPLGRDELLLPDDQRRVESREFLENIQEIIDLARERGAVPVLLTSPVYPDTTGNYNEAVRGIARDQNVWLVDLETYFKQLGVRHLLLDDCHPTAEGHRLIAGLLADLVPKIMTLTEPGVIPGNPQPRLLEEPGGSQ